MKRPFLFIICIFFLLTGCWNNQELDQVALVHGVGLDYDKSDEMIKMSVEIIKPTNQQEGGQIGSQGKGQHIILEHEAPALLDAARGLIRYAKRRLDFGHATAWIISEALAKEDFFIYSLDAIRRDQMLRLNSFLLITDQDPNEILGTPTLYENLSSNELVSALDQTRFIEEFSPVTLREFFKLLEEPIHNAYAPIITIQNVGKETITTINETAVIKNTKMVGKLNQKETIGLNYLLNRIKGGSVSVLMNEKDRTSLEIKKAHTKINPQLNGKRLKVDIETNIEGTISENVPKLKVTEKYFTEIETKFSRQVEENMQAALKKLQGDLRTDITRIGSITYRKYPKKWQAIRSEWNDIFANAEITIHVDTNITHQGLINENINRDHKKPNNNPYRFSK